MKFIVFALLLAALAPMLAQAQPCESYVTFNNACSGSTTGYQFVFYTNLASSTFMVETATFNASATLTGTLAPSCGSGVYMLSFCVLPWVNAPITVATYGDVSFNECTIPSITGTAVSGVQYSTLDSMPGLWSISYQLQNWCLNPASAYVWLNADQQTASLSCAGSPATVLYTIQYSSALNEWYIMYQNTACPAVTTSPVTSTLDWKFGHTSFLIEMTRTSAVTVFWPGQIILN
jgi:hypothetical protein